MRTIKFRGKRIDNGEWVYGSLIIFRQDFAISFESPNGIWGNTVVTVDPSTVGQFTGLHDKDGKEIWEGDIVRILYTDWPSNTDPKIKLEDYLISISHVGYVIYLKPSFAIQFSKLNKYDELSYGSFNYGTHGRLESIGNIHDNPELIKQ